MRFESFITRRYLRVGQKQAFVSLIGLLSIAGVAVGVMALIVVIAVMAGFEADLKERLLSMQAHVVLTPRPGTAVPADGLTRLEQIPGVLAAAAFVESQVMLRSDKAAAGVLLRGVDPQRTAAVIDAPIDLGVLENVPPSASAAPSLGGIVLGQDLARQLGVVEGDRVFLVTPQGMLAPVGHVPAMRPFSVVGHFASGIYEYDGSVAFVRLSEAQRVLRMTERISGIQVRLKNIDQTDRVARAIDRAMGADFTVRPWTTANRSLLSALKLEKTAMFIILALIVSVAALNIAGALIMTVMEKARDIAILKALGATDGAIRRIFVMNGLTIGGLGVLIGACLGLGLCRLLSSSDLIRLPGDIFYITRLPVRLLPLDVLGIGLAAMGICLLATLYPAHQAARLNPVETIRHG